MKIYTRTGDQGKTGVVGGRVSKDDVRVEAYGTVDELNSAIGLAVSMMQGGAYDDMRGDLLRIQHELFDCGTDLARLTKQEEGDAGSAAGGTGLETGYRTDAAMAERLEQWIDRYDGETAPLRRFILPGGSAVSAQLHVCRTVCRRAERRVVTLAREQHINADVRVYLNRLSDLLFTMARAANVREGIADVEYVRGTEVFRQP